MSGAAGRVVTLAERWREDRTSPLNALSNAGAAASAPRRDAGPPFIDCAEPVTAGLICRVSGEDIWRERLL